MKVSLITVCYNSDKYIKDTFLSVLEQDYPNIEYVVVDGNSTDTTLSLIKEYEPRFEGRMKWVSEPDKGLYDAMNKGINMASGDIIGMLNSDDFFTSKDIISKVVAAFQKEGCEAVYGDIHFVNPDDLGKSVRYYSSAVFKPSLMRVGMMPAHPTFYAYKSSFEKCGYYAPGYKIAADFELLLRFIFIHKLKIHYLPLDFVTMRTGGLSTESNQNRVLIMKDHLKAFKEHGIFTNRFILSTRYFYKIFELIQSKFRKHEQ